MGFLNSVNTKVLRHIVRRCSLEIVDASESRVTRNDIFLVVVT